MNKITSVIFDMDGVIFDTERLCLDEWKRIGRREGLEGIEETCLRCVGTNSRETERIVRERYPGIDYSRLTKELSANVNLQMKQNGIPVKKGVRQILEFLHENAVPLAIASSTRSDIVKRELESTDLIKYFDVIIGGEMVSKSKPEPDIYLAAAKALNADTAYTAAIEDSFNGIRSAKAAGLTTIMVPDLKQPDEEISRLADFVCADLDEARALLAEKIKSDNVLL